MAVGAPPPPPPPPPAPSSPPRRCRPTRAPPPPALCLPRSSPTPAGGAAPFPSHTPVGAPTAADAGVAPPAAADEPATAAAANGVAFPAAAVERIGSLVDCFVAAAAAAGLAVEALTLSVVPPGTEETERGAVHRVPSVYLTPPLLGKREGGEEGAVPLPLPVPLALKGGEGLVEVSVLRRSGRRRPTHAVPSPRKRARTRLPPYISAEADGGAGTLSSASSRGSPHPLRRRPPLDFPPGGGTPLGGPRTPWLHHRGKTLPGSLGAGVAAAEAAGPATTTPGGRDPAPTTSPRGRPRGKSLLLPPGKARSRATATSSVPSGSPSSSAITPSSGLLRPLASLRLEGGPVRVLQLDVPATGLSYVRPRRAFLADLRRMHRWRDALGKGARSDDTQEEQEKDQDYGDPAVPVWKEGMDTTASAPACRSGRTTAPRARKSMRIDARHGVRGDAAHEGEGRVPSPLSASAPPWPLPRVSASPAGGAAESLSKDGTATPFRSDGDESIADSPPPAPPPEPPRSLGGARTEAPLPAATAVTTEEEEDDDEDVFWVRALGGGVSDGKDDAQGDGGNWAAAASPATRHTRHPSRSEAAATAWAAADATPRGPAPTPPRGLAGSPHVAGNVTAPSPSPLMAGLTDAPPLPPPPLFGTLPPLPRRPSSLSLYGEPVASPFPLLEEPHTALPLAGVPANGAVGIGTGTDTGGRGGGAGGSDGGSVDVGVRDSDGGCGGGDDDGAVNGGSGWADTPLPSLPPLPPLPPVGLPWTDDSLSLLPLAGGAQSAVPFAGREGLEGSGSAVPTVGGGRDASAARLSPAWGRGQPSPLGSSAVAAGGSTGAAIAQLTGGQQLAPAGTGAGCPTDGVAAGSCGGYGNGNGNENDDDKWAWPPTNGAQLPPASPPSPAAAASPARAVAGTSSAAVAQG
ncbi:hypothetical protein MMPV_009546 [Pyropia vietnamensis]